VFRTFRFERLFAAHRRNVRASKLSGEAAATSAVAIAVVYSDIA
jgi:hypothetical protein